MQTFQLSRFARLLNLTYFRNTFHHITAEYWITYTPGDSDPHGSVDRHRIPFFWAPFLGTEKRQQQQQQQQQQLTKQSIRRQVQLREARIITGK